MKILFITTENYGVNLYRIWQPAFYLEQKGHTVNYTMGKEESIVLNAYGYKKPVTIDLTEDTCLWLEKNKDQFDLIVSTRSSNPYVLTLLLSIREAYDKPFVMDFDDHFEDVPQYNLTYLRNQPESDVVKLCRSHMQNANAAQTPSKFLQQRYSKYNKNIYYLPNFIEPRFWDFPQRERKDKKVKIVIATSGARFGDVQDIKPAIEWALKKYNHVQFIFMGLMPDFALKYSKEKTLFIRWGKIPTFMRIMRYLNADIALAPLVQNDFNRSKSNLKYLDYGMTRVAGIYQKLDPYDCVKHGETGMLATDKRSWKECLKTLIEDKSLREKIKENAYQHVMDSWTPDKVVPMYERAYEEILNGYSINDVYYRPPSPVQRISQDSRPYCGRTG